MNMKSLLKEVNKMYRKTGIIKVVTEDNLSVSLKELLETNPTLFKNELPKIYDACYVIVDMNRI